MNGEQLYQRLKTGQINKTQLTNKELGEVYKYMVNSNRVSVKEIKPSVAQRFGLSTNEYKPLKVEVPEIEIPETERPEKQSLFGKIGNFFKTQTKPQSQSQSQPMVTPQIKPQPTSTNPELELVDLLSNLSMPKTEPTLDRGRTTKHERSQGSAYVPGNIVQPTPAGLTLGDRVEQGIKGIGYNWAGGNLSSIGTIASIGSDIEVNHRPESSFISPKDFYPNNPEYKDNRIAETLQLADKLLAKGSEHTAKGREGLGTAGGVAYDILTGAGQMGADIGTAAVTGVGMLPVLGTRVFGQGASEARQSGATPEQQIAYGAISAGIEIATEKLVGGLPMAEKLGMGGVADNTIKKLAQGIASSPRLAKAFTYIANMAGEGAEEMIAEILSPVAKKMTYDPNADWATIEEVLYSGLLGAGISGVMGGGVLLQGNNQTPTETPTKTQSVMTNENIEPDIQGFQNTIDIGLNQLYSVLDSGQKNEQAINTMITNLEKVKKLMPILSEYVDGHIERLSNYKVIKQPQTNEIEEVEQIVNDDVNVAQIEDNDVVEDIKPIDNIIPIEESRQEEVLQDSNEIVTETQQLDNVTNVTEETDNDTEIKATEQPTTNETTTAEQTVEEDSNIAQNEDKDVQKDLNVEAKTKFTSKKHKSPKSKNSTPYQAVLENDEVKIYYYDGRKKFGYFPLDYKAYLNIEETLARRKFIDKSMTNYLLERNGKAFNYKLNEQGMEDLKLYGFEEESESVQKAIDEVLKEAGLYKQTFREQFDEHSKKRKEKEQLQPKQEEVKTDVAKKETTEKQTYRYYLTQRPPSPGTFPKGTTDVVSFDTKQEVDGLEAWGYVEYDKPLTEKQISDYELREKATEVEQVNVAPDINVDTKTKSEVEQPTKETVTEEVKEEQEEVIDGNEQLIENVPNYFIYSTQKTEIAELKKEIEDYQQRVDKHLDEYGDEGRYGEKLDKAKEKLNKLTDEIQRKYFIKIDNRQINDDVKSKVDKMDENDMKYLSLEDIDEPYYPKNYFILSKEKQGMIFKEVKGASIKSDTSVDLFVHKIGKSWVVSEGKTGLKITEAPTKREAIASATEITKGRLKDSLPDIIKSHIEKHGATPRYLGIEKAKYPTVPIIETEQTVEGQTKSKAFKGEQSFIGKSSKPLIDMSRPLKKPTDIRKDITKKFGVPTSSKKFNRSKKFLGYYKVIPEVIRLRYDNQIGTVMHELGHHLDKKYGFNSLNKQLINDMINKMNPAFKDNYQKSELPGEAIAEFLRYYTTDPTTAEEFAGDFYELFEQTLSKEDLKNIQEIRSDVLRWVNAERTEKRQSTIVPLSQKKKVSERISETIKFEKANSVLFDRYAPIQEFVKTVEKLTGRKLPASLNPYMLVERTYKNNARIEGIIKGQLTDTEYNPLDTDDSLQKIVDDVKRDVTPFEDYLKLKHAITLAEKNHMIYSPDVYNNIDDMRQDLEFIEQQYPQFIELSERLYDWYDKFFKAWVVDTNMLGEDSKKIYTKMRQEYPYYVPMFRVREDGSSKQASSSLTDQKAPVDRLSEKGSDKDTISPIDNIITQVSRMVNAYSKNNVMRAIVENYNTVDGLGGFIDRVPPDMEKQILSTQSIKDSLETEFEDVENIDELINSIPDLIENYKPLTKSKDKEIVGVITKSGKRQFYQVFDKAFLNSLTNMNPTQLDATVRMIASVRRTTTALTTGLNPIFGIVSNAPRDFTQAYIFGSYKNPAEYVYEYVKALTSVIRRNDNYKTFRDIGGVYGSSMTTELRTKNDFIRRLTKYRKGQKVGAKNALSYIGELILDFNDAIETAPRLAEFNKAYKIAKNRGDSDYDATLYALSRADDVTLNFSRRGEIMNTAVGQSIPYLNAGLQGMDKLRRGLFTGEERTQTLIKSITMLTIPTILLWLAHKDDEDYEKLTKGIKDNYWILWKNPDGSFVRIPKPKDLAGIFSADFERALNSYFKEEGAGAFEGFQSTIADSLLPPVDTIFRPLIDVIGNEKWSGGKIVPMAMEYLPKTEQYDETTSRIAVELAQLIGKVAPDSNFASPKNVDYVLDQYYGGLADILLPMTTPTTYVDADTLKDKYDYLAMPMAAIMKTGELIGRKFKADPSYSNNVVNDFYDLRDKTIKANNAYKNKGVMSNDVDFVSENQFKAYYKSISSMWKTIDYIDSLVNKTLPDGHKESYEKLINQSRFADSTKQKVLDDLKDNKLNRESITMLQKTVRDEIVKLADKAVKEYKANHKENNELLKQNND